MKIKIFKFCINTNIHQTPKIKTKIKMIVKKIKILCFVDWYLPGFKAGGPIKSIANFVENLGDEFDIYIFCKDRDLSDTKQYDQVHIDRWNKVGKANVFYASKKNLRLKGLIKILNKTEYDILYLNSFFSLKFTILPLIIRKFLMNLKKPCIIAPKGNLQPEAFKIKNFKKKIYIKLFILLKLYKDLCWQASSKNEKKNIIGILGNKVKKIFIAPDFVPLSLILSKKNNPKLRVRGPLRLLFFARISPVKYLDFLLRVLIHVKASIELLIYGPKEDLIYWKKCVNLIDNLPSNIKVKIGGAVSHKELPDIFEQSDLFISPTKSEAFGNTIIESLSVGLPALISNRTLWKPDQDGGLEVLPLNKFSWAKKITEYAETKVKLLIKKRLAAKNYAKKYFEETSTLKKNKDLFYSVLSSKL